MKRVVECVDCRGQFTYEYTRGCLRQRCDECRQAHNKVRDRAKTQRWRDANPERSKEIQNKSNRARLLDDEYRRLNRERMVFSKYGITQAELDALIEKQSGRCAICVGPPNGAGNRLHIDHCHATGRIRGLLCSKCNTLIGLADDDPFRLRDAADYLKEC